MRKSTLVLGIVVVAAATGCGSGGGGSSSASFASTASSVSSSVTQGSFALVGSLATARSGHTATWMPAAGKVLVAGGRAQSGTQDVVVDSAELFDPSTGQWTPAQGHLAGGLTTGQSGRMDHGAVLLPNGRVLLVGGQSDVAGSNPLSSAETFDPTNATAAQFGAVNGSLSDAKADPVVFSVATSSGTEIAVMGGRRGAGSSRSPLDSLDIYASSTNTITRQSGRMMTARYGARALPTGSSAGAEWLITGGFAGPGASPSAAGFEVYDPVARTFKTSTAAAPASTNSQLFIDRANFAAGILGASVTLIGGRDASGGALDSVESYAPATNTWKPSAHLATPRQGHTATTLSSGAILVIGGQSLGGQVLASAELIIASGTDASVVPLAATLHFARRNHTATLIQIPSTPAPVEGVLVTGGEDAYGNPIATAEVWAPAGTNVPFVNPPSTGQPPAITSLNPVQGPIGTTVTIAGQNFSWVASQDIVKFNGIVTPVTNAVAGQLTVTVPQGATTGNVTVSVGGVLSNPVQFTVTTGSTTTTTTTTSTTTATTTFSGPPQIFILLPTSGPAYMPLGIGGTNFDNGTIPFVNGVPSVSLFNWSTSNLPLVGTISVGFTIVPPAAPPGNGNVQIMYNNLMSNQFPFTKS